MTQACVYCGAKCVRADRSFPIEEGSYKLMCSACSADRRAIPHNLYVQVLMARHDAEGRRLNALLNGDDGDVTPSAAQETGDTVPKPKTKVKSKAKTKPEVEPEPVQEKKWEPHKVRGRVMIMSGELQNGEDVEEGEPEFDPTTGHQLDNTVWKFFDDDPDEETLAAEAEWEDEQIRKHEERKGAPEPEKGDMQDILAEWDD